MNDIVIARDQLRTETDRTVHEAVWGYHDDDAEFLTTPHESVATGERTTLDEFDIVR